MVQEYEKPGGLVSLVSRNNTRPSAESPVTVNFKKLC